MQNRNDAAFIKYIKALNKLNNAVQALQNCGFISVTGTIQTNVLMPHLEKAKYGISVSLNRLIEGELAILYITTSMFSEEELNELVTKVVVFIEQGWDSKFMDLKKELGYKGSSSYKLFKS